MSSSPPERQLLAIPHTLLSKLMLHTKIAECVLQFIDEIYQILVHFEGGG